MLLADPVEVHHFAVEVVQHFDLGGLLAKEYLRAARECFNVGRMLRERGDDLFGERAFAANVRRLSERSANFWALVYGVPSREVAALNISR